MQRKLEIPIVSSAYFPNFRKGFRKLNNSAKSKIIYYSGGDLTC